MFADILPWKCWLENDARKNTKENATSRSKTDELDRYARARSTKRGGIQRKKDEIEERDAQYFHKTIKRKKRYFYTGKRNIYWLWPGLVPPMTHFTRFCSRKTKKRNKTWEIALNHTRDFSVLIFSFETPIIIVSISKALSHAMEQSSWF